MKDFVFLYGPPGVGKSTVGKLLAADLNLPFIDLDDEIVNRAKKQIPEIFSEEGEESFRVHEQEIINKILSGPPGIIALGGGALLNNQNRAKVEANGQVVFLEGSINVLSERLINSDSIRPLISEASTNKLKDLISHRVEHYASFSKCCNTDNLSPEDVVWEIQKLTGRFRVRGMGDGYQVRVESGGIVHFGQLIIKSGCTGSLIVVTDENVGSLYASKILDSLEQENFEVHLHTIPPGESQKNLETVTEIWDAFLSVKLDRGSTAIALGGGVIGDLTGFAAATFMRGIEWVNLPTTLLAMVDASIGGKTGFNLPQGKNLIGAFHPPQYVLIDPGVLTTLPEVELRCGLAEVVKHGVIGSPSLFEKCVQGWPTNSEEIEELVKEAISVKMKVIQNDPYEKGFRASLNLGHTVGHAVELLSSFKIPHGEAVAIGLVAEARLAERLGITDVGFIDSLTSTLDGLGLPTDIPKEFSKKEIIKMMQMDKKVSNRRIGFALPERVGQVKIGVVVDELEAVFAQI
ncbi:MAG: 3-dehydroquinate synthase [Chloroflexi bacterium]|nr:3-dehydroquinate synthase [Chloroflexota bacterium]